MKIKIIIIMAFLFLIMPFEVEASTSNLSLSCNKTKLLPNESTTCTITGTSSSEITTVSAKVSVDSNLTLGSIVTSSTWQGNGEDGFIALYTDNNKTGTFPIATFTVTAKNSLGNVKVYVDSIVFSDSNWQEIQIPTVTKTINIYENVVETPEEPSDGGGSTTKPSNPGSSNNEDKKSSDATLKSLVVDISDFTFDANVLEYNLEVSNTKKTVSISADANDSKAVVTLPSNFDLEVGNNVFEIKVVAEDGTTKVYKLNIKRLEKILSNNAYLSNITIENYPIEFDKVNTSYHLAKINETYLNLNIETEDSNATYKVYGNNNLSNNDSIVIQVTAEDGTTKEYIIYITEVAHKQGYDFGLFLLIFVILSSISMNMVFLLTRRKKM